MAKIESGYQMGSTGRLHNSIGDTISGSTGTPSGEYAYIGLYAFNVSAAITLQYLRMAHASYGVIVESNSGGSSIRHCQFVKVGTPLYVYSTTASVQNVLIHQAATTAIYGELSTINAEHLTIHNANKVFDTGTLNLTNSLLVTITNSGTSFNGAYNATNPSGGVFTIVGSGSHYLADSTYRNVGKTNISVNLAADFKKLTTYPPIVLTNYFSVSTTLNPQAQRDTDAPDLGYHYDPLDYCWSDLNLTNATLTLTNGVAVGFYGTNGLILKAGSVLVSEGTPSNLNRIARFHTVQEQPTLWGAKGNAMLTMTGTYTPLPTVRLRFTDIPAMALSTTSPGDRTFIYEMNNILESLTLVDCQMRGSTMYYTPHNDPYTSSVLMTNNLAERSNFYVQRSGTPTPLTVNFRNNLFWRTGFYLVYDFRSGGSNPTWDIKDNVFDNCSMTEGGTNYTSYILNSYNGYVGTGVLLASSGGNDQTPTNFTYAVGALGPWYQSSTNMIDKGSVTNAALTGLYHYTTRNSQAKETNSILDIGFHYVAAEPDTAGLVGWWMLDEAVGTLASDSSGYRHDGTLLNGPTWTSGAIAGALNFDGSNDSVSIADSTALCITDDITIAFWTKKNAEATLISCLVGKANASVRNYGIWEEAGTSKRLLFQQLTSGGQGINLWTTTSLDVGTWYHVAAVVRGTNAYFYINGVLDNSGTRSIAAPTTTDPVTFGYSGWNDRYPGVLDEVRIYNRALAADEIVALANRAEYDTNGDGIPDYLADRNGNGIAELGEIPFGITIDNPVNGAVIH